jgi:F0F1-type ATP synthase assembly protein I
MQEFEKWLARVLLLNSALALGVCLGLLGESLAGTDLYLVFGAALLGFLSAVLSLKRRRAGLWGGGLYYAVQAASYFAADGSWHVSVKAGVSIGLVLQFPAGVLVLNLVALTLLAATVTVLALTKKTN